MTTTPALPAAAAPGGSTPLDGGRPLRRYLLWYGLASAGFTLIWGGVGSILLPSHIQQIVMADVFTGADAGIDLTALQELKSQVAAGAVRPNAAEAHQLELLATFDASRARALATVTSIAVSMFAPPIVGALSDRTRSPWGRRAPWILAGVVVGAGALVLTRYSTTVGLLMIAWPLAQTALSCALGPLNTTIADRVVTGKLGVASSITGLGQMVGGVFGGLLAGILFGAVGLNAYLVFAGGVLALVLMFLWRAPDRSSAELLVGERVGIGRLLVSFLQPLRDADYRWVWIAKLIMAFGYATSTAFALYMLQSYVRPALSLEEATRIAPLLPLIGLPGMLIAMGVAGKWSDRIGRRKPFVFWASVAMSASFLIPLAMPTVSGLMIQQVISGLAFGTFLVVDQALLIAVLPDSRAAGRNLGMGNLGGNVGQALGPMVAAQIVAITGGYASVWWTALVVVALAAIAILPVRRAR